MNVTVINPDSKGTLGHFAAAAIPLSAYRSSSSRQTYSLVIFILTNSPAYDLGSRSVQSKEELTWGTAGKLVDQVRVAHKGLEENDAAVPT